MLLHKQVEVGYAGYPCSKERPELVTDSCIQEQSSHKETVD